MPQAQVVFGDSLGASGHTFDWAFAVNRSVLFSSIVVTLRCVGGMSKLDGVIEADCRLLCSFFTIPDPERPYQNVSTKSPVSAVSSRKLFGRVLIAVKILVRTGDGE